MALQERCSGHVNGGVGNYDVLLDGDSGVISDGDGIYGSGVSCQWIITPKVS